jgi:hypothetical protein
MVLEGSHVLLDTMVIIEAHGVGCWRAMLSHYRLDTVEKCMEECASGDQMRREYVPIDVQALQTDISPKSVAPGDLAKFTLQYPGAMDLDEGERELMAYALTLESGSYFICSSDRACLRAGFTLGMKDSFVSLEELIDGTGERVRLRKHFTKTWLEQVRTDFLLKK